MDELKSGRQPKGVGDTGSINKKFKVNLEALSKDFMGVMDIAQGQYTRALGSNPPS